MSAGDVTGLCRPFMYCISHAPVVSLEAHGHKSTPGSGAAMAMMLRSVASVLLTVGYCDDAEGTHTWLQPCSHV